MAISVTVEPPLNVLQMLTLILTTSLSRIVLKKPLHRGHLSLLCITMTFAAPNDAQHYKITSCYSQLHPLLMAKRRIFEKRPLSKFFYSTDKKYPPRGQIVDSEKKMVRCSTLT